MGTILAVIRVKEATMATRTIRAIGATGVLLGFLWLSPPAGAGSIDHQLRFSTDFAFVVNGREMPAGTYIARRVDQKDPRVLEITNRIQRGVLVSVQHVRHEPGDRVHDAGVLFERAGDRYVLRTLWADGSGAVESITAAEEIADAIERRPLDEPETRVVPASAR
jgi:hypothetical protein